MAKCDDPETPGDVSTASNDPICAADLADHGRDYNSDSSALSYQSVSEEQLPVITNESASRSRDRTRKSSNSPKDASYNRPYQLASGKKNKSQQRSNSQQKDRSWNAKKSKQSPKEELPKIEIAKKSKYNYLSEGKSTSGAPKKRESYHIANTVDDDDQLLRPVDHNERSYATELRKQLIDANFEKAYECCVEEGTQSEGCKPCCSLFRTFSKNKELMSADDLHELLLLFTNPGVALREATDFLWEECDQKSALNFVDFLRYGSILRFRLLDFEAFADLTDDQKLLVTAARVFPGVPTEDAEKARVKLMIANRQQVEGNVSHDVRPLRIYEHLFLETYQRKLYRKGSAEIEEEHSLHQPETSSEYPSQHRAHQSDEDISWAGGDPQSHPREHREADYPALANCNRGNPKAQRRVARGRRAPKQKVLGTRPGNIPFAMRQKPPFNLEFQSKPSTDKYVGRMIDDEYEERRAADDYLLQRIQENFAHA